MGVRRAGGDERAGSCPGRVPDADLPVLSWERLSPDERAAFLLRSVFDYEYAEIAEVVDKSEVHVRQIVSRAKQRLERGESRSHPSPQEASALGQAVRRRLPGE